MKWAIVLVLVLGGCQKSKEGTGLTPGTENPCGICKDGEFCLWQPDDSGPDCGSMSCYSVMTWIPEECWDCFANPKNCDFNDPWKHTYCLESLCTEEELFSGAELAPDGTIVIYCMPYGDTECSF